MHNDVKYRPGESNTVLREALLSAWDDRCYWCKQSATFRDVDIDHVVPQDLKGVHLLRVLADLGLPKDFDLHDPANLAPIHKTCNGEKRNAFDTGAPRIVRQLQLVAKRRAAVIRVVRGFRRTRDLDTALVALQSADLGDVEARTAVTAVVQSISRALWPDRFERAIRVPLDSDANPLVRVALDSESTQSAVKLLDTIWGRGTLDAIVADMVRQTWHDAYEQVRGHFDSLEIGGIEPVTASSPTATYRVWSIRSLSFERDDADFTFELEGSIDAAFSVSLAVSSSDGSYLQDDEQGDAYVESPFSWRVNLSVDGPEFELIDYEVPALDETQYFTSLDGRNQMYLDMQYEALLALEEGDDLDAESDRS